MLKIILATLVAASVLFPSALRAQEPLSPSTPANPAAEQSAPQEIQITVQQIGEGMFMLQGHGGNILVSIGDEGLLMIDSDYSDVTPTLLKAIQSFSNKPIKFLINTHWHGDHTGGNTQIGASGASIIAHENARARMAQGGTLEVLGMTFPPTASPGLPTITFKQDLMMHHHDEDISLMHLGAAHTDGDIIVIFPRANIIHMGDLFFNGFYPFIDVSSGGDFDGMIASAEAVLALADEQTKIIPGHGPLASRAELAAYVDMLKSVRSVLSPLVAEGKTAQDIVALDPLESYNPEWGDGLIPAAQWLPIAVSAINPKQTAPGQE